MLSQTHLVLLLDPTVECPLCALVHFLSSVHNAHPNCACVLQAPVQMSLLPTGPTDPSPGHLSGPSQDPTPTLRVGFSERRHCSSVGRRVSHWRAGPAHSHPSTRPWGSKPSVNICLIESGQRATSRQSQGSGTGSPGQGNRLGRKTPVRVWVASLCPSDFA